MQDLQEFLSYSIYGLKVLDIIIAITIFMLCVLLRQIVSKVIISALRTLTRKTKTKVDDEILDVIEEPLKLSTIILGTYLAKTWLQLETFNSILETLIKSFTIFILFWTLYRIINRFKHSITIFSANFGKELSKDIENFIIKTLKFIVIIIGVMSILQEWGINVTAFVASLGLVGMAFALAAKDTAANFFGSLVIFIDRPFRIGDWVETPQVEGIVEDIGIRSTKVRTFAQALASVPNANMANVSITNWSRMKKRRIKMRLGLTYSTDTTQMEAILEDLRTMLHSHPDIHQDQIMIYFDEFADSSLSLFCYFFTNTTVWQEFLRVKEDVNLRMMKIVEKHNASFAFPSQSLYIEQIPNEKML
jgi:MscS family membrane protein